LTSNREQIRVPLCPVAVDPQEQAKTQAQFWRRFHNGGIAALLRFSQSVVRFNACQGMHR